MDFDALRERLLELAVKADALAVQMRKLDAMMASEMGRLRVSRGHNLYAGT